MPEFETQHIITPQVENQPLPPTSSPTPDFLMEPSSPRGSNSPIRMVGVLLVLAVFVIGGGSAYFLASRNQTNPVSAWDCSKYTFNVSQSGVVTILNSSTNNEPAQNVDIFINGQKVSTLPIPALSSGNGATVGNVTVPSGAFSWQAKGSLDCQNSGSYTGPSATPQIVSQCTGVSAYDKNWNKLTAADLTHLKPGDVVNFAVSGNTTSGNFDKARFTINGVQNPEVTTKRPGSDDYYQTYTIPAGATINFSVNAEVHHQQLNQWF